MIIGAVCTLATACVVPPGPPPGTTTTTGAPVTPGDPGPSDVVLTIRSSLGVKAISPLVYGTNGATNLGTNHQGLVRLGGNRWTAYNWENNASNAGSDWCYQNDGYLSGSNTPGDAVKGQVDQAKAAGAAVLLTLPIVDYVAADKNGGCDVRGSGPDYLQTRFRQNRSTKPSALSTSPDTTDGFVYQDEYINWLKMTEGSATVLFSLDNEPDLWSETHAEIHPSPVSYSELAARNIDHAKAVKRVWPTAKVSGPVNYGFAGFENLQGAPDSGGHGNFLDWWLDQMKAADVSNGKRLVDYLDLHWYPEARGAGVRITGDDTSPAVVAARVQAPRSLWDPSYVEDSWITTDYGYGAIRLIPRTRDRIAVHYPGTQMAVSEWNYGGGDHISGAVASADVLGIFGREGVGMAAMWPMSGESYTYAAFRAFRNYDGAGHGFGDTSIDAQSSSVAKTTVYASQDTANPNRVVLVAINKATTSTRAGIAVSHPQRFTRADTYTITAAGGATVVPAGSVSSVATNAFNLLLPPMSVTVLALQP